MNTKELFDYARWCYLVIDGDDVVDIRRAIGDDVTSITFVDGRTYCIADQEVEIKTLNNEIQPLLIQAEIPGRLEGDRLQEVEIQLQRLVPVSLIDLRGFKILSKQNPW